MKKKLVSVSIVVVTLLIASVTLSATSWPHTGAHAIKEITTMADGMVAIELDGLECRDVGGTARTFTLSGDEVGANRIFSTVQAAYLSGKPISIGYDSSNDVRCYVKRVIF